MVVQAIRRDHFGTISGQPGRLEKRSSTIKTQLRGELRLSVCSALKRSPPLPRNPGDYAAAAVSFTA